MADRERDQNLHVRMAEEEMRMLRALTEDMGLSTSDVVRQLIRRAFAERSNEKHRPRKR
jgi:hypothetical protein